MVPWLPDTCQVDMVVRMRPPCSHPFFNIKGISDVIYNIETRACVERMDKTEVQKPAPQDMLPTCSAMIMHPKISAQETVTQETAIRCLSFDRQGGGVDGVVMLVS